MTARERWLVGIIMALSLALPASGVYWFKVGFREGRASAAIVPHRATAPAGAVASPQR